MRRRADSEGYVILALVVLIIGILVGRYAFQVQGPQSMTTFFQTFTLTNTDTLTSTLTTYSIPANFTIRGLITPPYGTTPTMIFFASAGRTFNFSVSGSEYQGSLPNSLPYTVTIAYHNDITKLPGTGTCGAFNETIAWGSSSVVADWACSG